MNANSIKQNGHRFVGKIVKSVVFRDNKFEIAFTDDGYIEVETDDEPLEYEIEE